MLVYLSENRHMLVVLLNCTHACILLNLTHACFILVHSTHAYKRGCILTLLKGDLKRKFVLIKMHSTFE